MCHHASSAGHYVSTKNASLREICNQLMVLPEGHVVHGADEVQELSDAQAMLSVAFNLTRFKANELDVVF